MGANREDGWSARAQRELKVPRYHEIFVPIVPSGKLHGVLDVVVPIGSMHIVARKVGLEVEGGKARVEAYANTIRYRLATGICREVGMAELVGVAER